MMSELYQEHILDHYANPRNEGRLEAPDIVGDADDPSCGDQVHIEINLDAEGRVAEVAFEGEGCMVSMASASMFTEYIKGKSLAELAAITEEEAIAILEVPIGSNRRRCALLPLEVLQAGLRAYRE
ncbi:MAG: SUF system NifU family Fe-S cluster assembly protein [Anaerolineae bacterium]|nr:SUF system NifU family Fe-S cluster assembly protein [Anaerolineae bacterium]